MGEVYLADDTQLGRRVALKFLASGAAADPVAARRLVREARGAATLDHPHIGAVYEVGEADGRPFIAMQYVEGQPLDERVRRGSGVDAIHGAATGRPCGVVRLRQDG